jgi:hypothetical protein
VRNVKETPNTKHQTVTSQDGEQDCDNRSNPKQTLTANTMVLGQRDGTKDTHQDEGCRYQRNVILNTTIEFVIVRTVCVQLQDVLIGRILRPRITKRKQTICHSQFVWQSRGIFGWQADSRQIIPTIHPTRYFPPKRRHSDLGLAGVGQRCSCVPQVRHW